MNSKVRFHDIMHITLLIQTDKSGYINVKLKLFKFKKRPVSTYT